MNQTMTPRIFADCAAGMPTDPAVLQEMLPYFGAEYANPSSLYTEGVRAARALAQARERVAAQLGAHPDEIYFTSGATEADNWVIRCADVGQGGIITSELEHPAVAQACRIRAAAGPRVTYVDVLASGRISIPSLQDALARGGQGALVTLMYANHETGVLQPLKEAIALTRAHGGLLFCDAVQAVATQSIDVHALGVDFLAISGHKLGAPRGIGALYVRRGVSLSPLLHGGGQERGGRSGTESVALAVALAKSLELCAQRREQNEALRALSLRLLGGLREIPGVLVNGWENTAHQLPGTVNVCVDCIGGGALVLWLDRHGVCVSAGSACSSAGNHPSRVLLAMGREESQAMSAVRISICAQNTTDQVDQIVRIMCEGVRVLRSLDIVGSVKYGENGTK